MTLHRPLTRMTCLAWAGVLVAGLAQSANAADIAKPAGYPARSIELTVPFGPGGGADIFARAMLPPAGAGLPLMLSGTAAVVGHRSQHVDDITEQLEETLRNLDALLAEAQRHAGRIDTLFGPQSPLKVYVRRPEDIAAIESLLSERLPSDTPRLLLHADICRRDLLVEIDGFHG